MLHVNSHGSQVLISIGNDHQLILLEGGKELLLMGGEVLLAFTPSEQTPYPSQEAVDLIVNLSQWERGAPG